MTPEDEGFLARWSRLKRGASAERAEEPPPPPAPTPAPAAKAEAEVAPPLPDIETLTKDSDFTPFLQAHVPPELQRRALRKLWASDPIFSQPDGLTDYADDFRNPEVVGDAVKTAWKIGKGFLDDAEAETPVAAAEERDEEKDGEAEGSA